MREYSFEKLEAWKKSRELNKEIYMLTKNYPQEERYGLVSQMRRCSVSVSSNLAEGSSRKSLKDQAHFAQISYSSLIELLNQLILSFDLNFVNKAEYNELREKIENLTYIINSLRKSQLSRSNYTL
jgi:four helix bundle protein